MPVRKIRELAVRFELAMNSVYPMPGLIRLLDWLREKEKLMGVISNAQFYTPLIFESLLGKTMIEAGFEEELMHFSYRTGRAKPGKFLYKTALKSIEKLGLASAEVLYIGNDMEKDILPAKRVGFRTGLFAGDQRSLRLGKEPERVNGDSVDLVLTDLSQVTGVI